MVWSCEAHAFKVEDLKLSAGASSLVAVDAGGTARIWPVRRWKTASLREATENLLWDAVFRPDGVLITESEALEFTAWDVRPGEDTGRMRALWSAKETSWSQRV
jgi:hypothetical protein